MTHEDFYTLWPLAEDIMQGKVGSVNIGGIRHGGTGGPSDDKEHWAIELRGYADTELHNEFTWLFNSKNNSLPNWKIDQYVKRVPNNIVDEGYKILNT